jgi:hypothetical protein
VPDNGLGAITSTSGSTVWARAIGGAVHSPTAIVEPTTELRPPHRQISLLLIGAPYSAFRRTHTPQARFEDRIKIVRRWRCQFGGF